MIGSNKFSDFIITSIPSVVGAFFNTYAGHPFDTVRVRLQDVNTKYKSSFGCLTKTIKYEGIRGLFKGSISSLYGAIAENIVVFGVNEFIKREFYYVNTKTSIHIGHDMMVGAISGFAATVASCPFETIKCNMQINKYNSMIHMFKDLKLYGLYTGFNASCARNIPFYILFFPLYTRYIELLTYSNKQNINVMTTTIAGGLSGAMTWAIIYPFDVIKCNQQIQQTHINMFNMSKMIYRTKGIRGFFAGLNPTIARAFIANAALIFGIESMNHLLGIDGMQHIIRVN
jgi:hypothetical protein